MFVKVRVTRGTGLLKNTRRSFRLSFEDLQSRFTKFKQRGRRNVALRCISTALSTCFSDVFITRRDSIKRSAMKCRQISDCIRHSTRFAQETRKQQMVIGNRKSGHDSEAVSIRRRHVNPQRISSTDTCRSKKRP